MTEYVGAHQLGSISAQFLLMADLSSSRTDVFDQIISDPRLDLISAQFWLWNDQLILRCDRPS